MKSKPRPLVAGNWKMNGGLAAIEEIVSLNGRLADANLVDADVAICPPATLLGAWAAKSGSVPSAVQLGGQDCHTAEKGAHTGDLSAQMLADCGAKMVIVGHSERRADHGEDDAKVAAKALAVWSAGLIAVICVGETLEIREAGRAVDIVTGQVAASVPDGATSENTVIAYEPVWAIGTGKTPTLDDVAEMHAAIRQRLADRFGTKSAEGMRILYGGSVKPDNADALLNVANVNGALVGGASLKADDFWGIIKVYT